MKRIVIVANAPWRWEEDFVTLVHLADEVLAADGGANHLARIGVRPTAVVGDLDSIRPSVRRWVGEERIVERPSQDATDLDKTLAFAFDERGATAVTVLAATGGRLDHALENLSLLARFSARGELDGWDASARIVPVVERVHLATRPGQGVSLLPLGRCEHVWGDGLHWPLAGEALDLAARTSVSNRAEGETIEVRVAGGALLVFLLR
ncbi:MAG: thiamine diphosphokinase [Thermoanaerobaculales bacterium]